MEECGDEGKRAPQAPLEVQTPQTPCEFRTWSQVANKKTSGSGVDTGVRDGLALDTNRPLVLYEGWWLCLTSSPPSTPHLFHIASLSFSLDDSCWELRRKNRMLLIPRGKGKAHSSLVLS